MRAYINDFTGICNRFEALIFAFSIREYFGHEIWLDWPELDALQIAGTQRGGGGVFSRINSVKIRDCDYRTFETLYRYKNIHIRGLSGAHPESLDRQLPKVLDAVRLRPELISAIKKMFTAIGKPVIGVHIRRGDFAMPASVEDLNKLRHSAIPDSWLVKSLEALQSRFPGVHFYLSATGRIEDYKFLFDRFPCHMLEVRSPYSYKGAGHSSETHPVADLFALSCCSVILATPRSSFSHWAANCFGGRSTVITARLAADSFGDIILSARNFGLCRLPQWMEYDWMHSDDNIENSLQPDCPNTDWL
jgi:hypothetical protein